jgi:hypothetical protein
MDQITLAKLSGVSANTIRSMEARKAETLTSGLDTVRAVQSALEAAGVEFLNGEQPGVRLRKRDDRPAIGAPPTVEEKGDVIGEP